MTLPTEPVTLSVVQVGELNQKLSHLRHDVNNKLSIIAASLELIRRRPEDADRLLNSLGEQPRKISEIITQFSADIESVLGIKQP